MAESDPPHTHPLTHLSEKECYDFLIAERAALIAARQNREDGLIGTITQISSAALLLIPGALASTSKVPKLQDARFLYVGIAFFRQLYT